MNTPSTYAPPVEIRVNPDGEGEPLDWVSICRVLLRVVAFLEESDYTEPHTRQIEVLAHPDLPDPASESSTSQG